MAHGSFTFEPDKKAERKIENVLKGMSTIDKNAVVQSALVSGMQMIVNAGKQNLAARNKRKTGNLAKSFTVKTYKKKMYTLGGFKRSAPKKGLKGGNHSYLVDKGTGERSYINKNGRLHKTGAISKIMPNLGSYFWTDAVASEGPKAQAGLVDSVYKAITDIMDKNT